MGQRSATLEERLYKGGLEGYVAQSEEELAIQALLSEVDLLDPLREQEHLSCRGAALPRPRSCLGLGGWPAMWS